jgi:hypothetical protein
MYEDLTAFLSARQRSIRILYGIKSSSKYRRYLANSEANSQRANKKDGAGRHAKKIHRMRGLDHHPSIIG